MVKLKDKWVVLVRGEKDRRAQLLGSKGSLVRLRLHAVLFPDREKAVAAAKALEQDNPGYHAWASQ